MLTKVTLGEGDAGIVYASDVAKNVGALETPDQLNTIAAYPIAQNSDSPNQKVAQALVEREHGGIGV